MITPDSRAQLPDKIREYANMLKILAPAWNIKVFGPITPEQSDDQNHQNYLKTLHLDSKNLPMICPVKLAPLQLQYDDEDIRSIWDSFKISQRRVFRHVKSARNSGTKYGRVTEEVPSSFKDIAHGEVYETNLQENDFNEDSSLERAIKDFKNGDLGSIQWRLRAMGQDSFFKYEESAVSVWICLRGTPVLAGIPLAMKKGLDQQLRSLEEGEYDKSDQSQEENDSVAKKKVAKVLSYFKNIL